jgi:hypothetical protein
VNEKRRKEESKDIRKIFVKNSVEQETLTLTISVGEEKQDMAYGPN